jgi:hypothetical protein
MPLTDAKMDQNCIFQVQYWVETLTLGIANSD